MVARAGVGKLANRRRVSGMSKSKYAMVLVPLVSIFAAGFLSLPAMAQIGGQQQSKGPPAKGPPAKAAPQRAAPVQRGPAMGARPNTGPLQGARTGPQQGYRQGPQQGYRQGQQGYRQGGPRQGFVGNARVERRAWGGRQYYGRMAWDRGRWRHEWRNGRYGWWWDVGGAWYYYEQPMDGPPTMISDVQIMDDPDAAEGPPPDEPQPVEAGPPGYYPPPAVYVPPPPVVYVPPPPVYVPPPVVCVGPFCIR
jgi:hypothetical protein